VVQALELLNGEEFYQQIYSAKLAAQAADEQNQLIDRFYWAALSRPASAQEQSLGSNFLGKSLAEGGAGDVLWALFASPEFQYIR
jgi:hypothetical protein